MIIIECVSNFEISGNFYALKQYITYLYGTIFGNPCSTKLLRLPNSCVLSNSSCWIVSTSLRIVSYQYWTSCRATTSRPIFSVSLFSFIPGYRGPNTRTVGVPFIEKFLQSCWAQFIAAILIHLFHTTMKSVLMYLNISKKLWYFWFSNYFVVVYN